MAKKKKKSSPYRPMPPIHLAERHGWRCSAGHKLFVADRGAVMLEYPNTWIVRGDEDSIKFRDAEPPDDLCVLAVSYMRIAPVVLAHVPLLYLVNETTEKDGDRRNIESWEEPREMRRLDVEIVWRQGHYLDATQDNRRAITRFCLGRRQSVQALLTMDFWEDDVDRFGPIWDAVLESLQLDERIPSLSRGPLLS